MKKYLIFVFTILFSYLGLDYLYYYQGDLYIPEKGEVEIFTKVADDQLWIDEGNGFEVLDIQGVNLGLGKAGSFATEYGITKEDYLLWFEQIQALGANVIRTYTIAHSDFYEAFYEYNVDNSDPLYLIHGVWLEGYLVNSHLDAYDDKFQRSFIKNSKDVVDVVHGRHKGPKLNQIRAQSYKNDISPWVYGYILGVEWNENLVAYTDQTVAPKEQYTGEYIYTEEASNFEIMLAQVGDEMIRHETEKYGTQRTISFSNWAITDPFTYPKKIAEAFLKYSTIDTENIKVKDTFKSGQYASYHVYPHYPEFMSLEEESVENGYLAYLEKLVDHHEMPVLISEFGVSSSRGQSSYEQNRDSGRNQGGMTEAEQGEALVSMYEDIKASGAVGGIVFSWQDEWFKRTWNTAPFVDSNYSAYWSDVQTSEQGFGLLAFEPGEEERIVYIDGDQSEWQADDLVINEDYQLSMKYDEEAMYFLAETEDFDWNQNKMYIPVDVTPNSGSKLIEQYDMETSHPTDFLIEIDGTDNSRVWVQERYNATRTIHGAELNKIYKQYEAPPAKDSPVFQPIELILHEADYFNEIGQIPFSEFDLANEKHYSLAQTYETGKLIYGNGNPTAKEYNSLADFHFGDSFVEIHIPWSLLNFSDPTEMKVHDDYYENYGVEHLRVDHINVGLGDGSQIIEMIEFKLEKLGKKPAYHERLKESYYILQEYWTSK